jgi:hypothetical protein
MEHPGSIEVKILMSENNVEMGLQMSRQTFLD